jgi:N-glycosylase/DNA lyase
MSDDQSEATAGDATGPDRWTLVRDALALQFKLIVDGVRDFLLVPASIIAAVVSLLSHRDGKPGPQFYQLLALGKQSEEAIDLFGAYRNAPPEVRGEHRFSEVRLDDLVERVETFLADEVRKGGMTAQARERIDQALDSLQRGLGEKRRDASSRQDSSASE